MIRECDKCGGRKWVTTVQVWLVALINHRCKNCGHTVNEWEIDG